VLQNEERQRIKKCIDALKSPGLWQTVQHTSATIENLMLGYHILDMKGEAAKAAKSNIELLEQTAALRGWDGDTPVNEKLEGDEREIFDLAKYFLERRL
jgi:hypothetical protein